MKSRFEPNAMPLESQSKNHSHIPRIRVHRPLKTANLTVITTMTRTSGAALTH